MVDKAGFSDDTIVTDLLDRIQSNLHPELMSAVFSLSYTLN